MRLIKKMQEPERFSPAEQNMINYILAHKRELAELSIRDLAERTYSSSAGVFRLCQKLGLKGYNEFKLRFISEINRAEKSIPCEEIKIKRPITAKDGPEGIVQKMAALEIEAIEETKNEMNMEQLVRVAKMMRAAASIDIYAYDQNYHLAQIMVYNLLQVKCAAVANNSMTSQLAQALLSDDSHLAVLISRTGMNKRLLRTAQLLQQQGTKIVLFSTYERAPLAKYADEFLYVANALDLDYIDMGGMIFSVGVRYYQDVLFGLLLSQDFDGIEKFINRIDDGLGHLDDKDRLW
ncbi:MAG: MurR/RpiR family transcriptional regulator [Selenomonas sp.]|uniref:MurR/RpiR family transcriptional regulator n=1 Tax=Selenomonas sp. TaxID=2053611 RepID=UPI0025F15F53|nr:MurR/RpiR family transcriptional regulator [Selenomonas sp.]MCR5756344.1 MurR/RpiR family transcriptional regulator [Selenomonas sp.]